MLDNAVDQLLHNVLPAAADYDSAEQALTVAFNADESPPAWEAEARTAKRRAAELAIAIDGLTDRVFRELAMTKPGLRANLAALCTWPDTGEPRTGALERVRGVANAYKHRYLTDTSLTITSDADILVVGLGWGLDGWGVGKPSGVEVLVRETGGTAYKFLGDAPVAIAAWFKFLQQHGAVLPPGPFKACNLHVHR